MNWLKRIFSESASTSENEGEAAATRTGLTEAIGAALREHAQELQKALTPQTRQNAFSLWRQTIDADAHDYADLVLSYPDRQRIIQIEVDTFMQAYLNGYMAAQGWIEATMALQSAFLLGRTLRDQIRGLGIPLDSVNANVGVVMDKTLLSIVKLGLEAAKC